MKDRLAMLFASAFYIGFLPGAPGTYASVTTTLVFFLIYHFSQQLVPALHLSTVCLISLIGILAASRASAIAGSDDPSFIVIDEVAGQLLTFLFLPPNALNLILGTVAFRLFDIWKPFPIRKLESLGGGAGIMADDLLAGVYANLLLQIINLLFFSL
jgi:phosphatidylglycerophosphatase A